MGPETEADPAALLFQFLAAMGSIHRGATLSAGRGRADSSHRIPKQVIVAFIVAQRHVLESCLRGMQIDRLALGEEESVTGFRV